MCVQFRRIILGIAGAVFFFTGQSAFAQNPVPLKQFKDWAAYTYSDKNGKLCYALSKPKQSFPEDRNHGDVFFFVSTRSSENIKNEPSFLAGYPLKEGSSVTVKIGNASFKMFVKDDGAWLENVADEARLVKEMKGGREMEVSGTSSRGTQTRYIYSLSGISAALAEVTKACP